MDREELLHKEVKRQHNDRVPLGITYSKSLPDIRGILRKHYDTLYMSEKMQKVFAKPPLLAFRRDINICDTLVNGTTNCALINIGRKTLCLWVLQQIGEEWNPRHYRCLILSCTRRGGLQHAERLLCSACGMTVYVGETERSIKERFMEHLCDVRNREDEPINRHFKDHPATDVQIAVLAKMVDGSKVCRLLHEGKWIKLLNTKFPDGFDVKLYL